MNLASSLTTVTGIGPSTFLKLQKNGLQTVHDLLRLYPTRHDDYQLNSAIAFLQNGEKVTVKAKVIKKWQEVARFKRLTIQKIEVADKSGSLTLIWFNQPFILHQFKVNSDYYFSGKVETVKGKTVLTVAEYEPENQNPVHTNAIIPYYTSTLGISSRVLRQKIAWIFANLDLNNYQFDPFNEKKRFGFLPPDQALKALHFPSNQKQLALAKQRLSVEKLLMLKLAQLADEELVNHAKTVVLKPSVDKLTQAFISSLPFTLTKSQNQVISEIGKDFTNKINKPRLLMGDVGSGKTVIMAYAAYLMAKSGYSSAIMAPTEALAKQHLASFNTIFKTLNIKVALIIGKTKKSVSNQAQIFIGTQALLFRQASLANLGLVVVDEQHKFGVLQRQLLQEQSKILPRTLLVSATPIPRSLALTLYHQTNLSYLHEKPFTSQIKTLLVPEAKRHDSYQWLKKQLGTAKQQAYLVCPAIENKQGQINELKTVKEEEQKLKQILPGIRIKAIYSHHPQKQSLLDKFRKHEIDLLITTSLIEVGIDIGSANLMLIENAERFGLSQLHQLRGRIGRRGQKGYCLLFTPSTQEPVLKRLKILEKQNNASEIAVYDLKHRGSGDLLGIVQHGLNFVRTQDLLNPDLMAKINSLSMKMVANPKTKEYTSLLVNKLN